MRILSMSLILALGSTTCLSAQTLTLDCEAVENVGNEECLALPPAQEATNFAPLIAPALGGLAALVGLAAAAGGGANSTNTTTSTTSTVPN